MTFFLYTNRGLGFRGGKDSNSLFLDRLFWHVGGNLLQKGGCVYSNDYSDASLGLHEKEKEKRRSSDNKHVVLIWKN